MKVIIKAEPKEIAALVLLLQERQKNSIFSKITEIDVDKATHQILKTLQESFSSIRYL